MIQRIQTIYLLITIVLTSLVIGFPVMEILTGESVYPVTLFEANDGGSMIYSWGLLGLCIANILIVLATILQFKNRRLQIRLATFNILFIVVFYVVLGIYYSILNGKFEESVINPDWTVILPAINLILTYLSIRAIGRDEALVRATDRLR